MTKKEAIETLVALAVCSDSKLHCDDDCPFYDKRCEDNFEDNVAEAVKILNKELRGENKMLRKFEFVERVKSTGYEMKEPGFDLPKRSTKKSAGYDFINPERVEIPPYKIGSKPIMIPTGVKVYMPDDEYLMLVNRSSNPKKKFLVIPNSLGIVDAKIA